MDLYCIRCKTKTSTKEHTEVTSKNGRAMLKGLCDVCGAKKCTFVSKKHGGKSAIGKLPKPKAGWTPPGYKFRGPYNPLDKQLQYDPNTGEVWGEV